MPRRPAKKHSRAPSKKGGAGGGSSPHRPEGQRLQKVLAAAGYGSRRQCEELILDGRVEIDHQVVTELGTRVEENAQEIRVDGEVVPRHKKRYFLVHKPRGLLSTNRDPEGRPRVIDLVESSERLFTVGRLDKSSEGLMLVTNDGELANRLAHPRYGIARKYHVVVAGHLPEESIRKLRKGVHLAEAVVRAETAHIKRRFKESTLIEMVLTEGRNREIRRMLAREGHKVQRLRRVAFGPLTLGELPEGASRELTPREVARLRKALDSPGGKARRQPKKRPATRQASAPGAAAESADSGPRRKKTVQKAGKPGARTKKTSARPAKSGRSGAKPTAKHKAAKPTGAKSTAAKSKRPGGKGRPKR